MSRTQSTRDAILTAAEELMAANGVYGADLNTIRLQAGQRNRSAIRYHFGGRPGLINAVILKHRSKSNEARLHLLSDLNGRSDVPFDVLAHVLIQPVLMHFQTPGGCRYLIILAEVMARNGLEALWDPKRDATSESLAQLNALIGKQIVEPTTESQRRRRVGNVILMVFALLADIARAVESGAITNDTAVLRAYEVEDIATAALQAPFRSESGSSAAATATA